MRVHISLKVASLENSLAFYSALFGQEASRLKDGYANYRLAEPPIHLALEESGKASPASASHYGVELADHEALGAWRRRIEEAGVQLAVEDEASCCYARADKLWLSDPDGNPWEVWVRTGEYEAMGSTRVEIPICGDKQEACCAA